MTGLKTKKNEASVEKFLNAVKDGKRRDECDKVLAWRVAHFVRLESPKDVSGKLISLLRASYKFTSEAKSAANICVDGARPVPSEG